MRSSGGLPLPASHLPRSLFTQTQILAKDPERNATEMRLKALTFYELAAEQRRASAYLRIGDFHYYGIAGLKKVESHHAHTLTARC